MKVKQAVGGGGPVLTARVLRARAERHNDRVRGLAGNLGMMINPSIVMFYSYNSSWGLIVSIMFLSIVPDFWE